MPKGTLVVTKDIQWIEFYWGFTVEYQGLEPFRSKKEEVEAVDVPLVHCEHPKKLKYKKVKKIGVFKGTKLERTNSSRQPDKDDNPRYPFWWKFITVREKVTEYWEIEYECV